MKTLKRVVGLALALILVAVATSPVMAEESVLTRKNGLMTVALWVLVDSPVSAADEAEDALPAEDLQPVARPIEGKHVGLVVIAAVDEINHTVTPMVVDNRLHLRNQEGEDLTLWQMYGSFSDSVRYEAMAHLLDGLFIEPVIDYYAALDIRGLELIDGRKFEIRPGEDEFSALAARFKSAADTARSGSVGDLVGAFLTMNAFLVTNLGSGRLMGLANDMGSYTANPTIKMTGS